MNLVNRSYPEFGVGGNTGCGLRSAYCVIPPYSMREITVANGGSCVLGDGWVGRNVPGIGQAWDLKARRLP